MELKESKVKANANSGYKTTEVGVIPVDWEVVPLNDCLDLLTDFESNGSFASVAANVRVYDHEEFAWYVRATDMENSSSLATVRYVDRKSYEFLKKTALYGGEVLITKRGEIGKVYLFEKRSDFATVAPNLYLLKLNKRAIPGFVYRYFKYGSGNERLKTINASTTLGALYKNDVKALEIPLPSIAEQHAIATALADVDGLIAGLEGLLAKKRALKQGAMQQLLSGQKRLPGFTGEWGVKRFHELARPRKERVDPRRSGPQVFCVELEHIEQGTGRICGHTIAGEGSSLKTVFREGDVLFGKLRAYLRKYWLANRAGVCSTEVWALVANPTTMIPAYLVQIVTLNSFVELASTAYGTHMPRSDWKVVKEFELRVPEPEEQTAIATVLSDMDAELAALEAKLDKTRLLKQGMMQELLTGRTRLV